LNEVRLNALRVARINDEKWNRKWEIQLCSVELDDLLDKGTFFGVLLNIETNESRLPPFSMGVPN